MLDTNITSLDSLSLAKASVKNLADTCSKENNVLKGTSVTPKENKQIERNEVSPFWEVGVVILALFVLAILKRAFSKKLDQYANALISNRFIGQLTREERSSESMSVILVEFLYFIITALFTNLLYKNINPEFILYGFEGFALFTLIYLVFHLLKVFVNNLLGWLLDLQIIITDFQFFNFLSHGAIAIFLFPIVVLLLFSHIDNQLLLGAGGLLILAMYLYRISRLARRFWWEKRFLLKYFILYICGLEILPVLVLAKFAFKTL
ncbi:MAG: hypothetical protein ACJASM_000016 [Salibacteraceae bacterium]|jgi:hypothetical protein